MKKNKNLSKKIIFGALTLLSAGLVAGNIVCFGVLGIDFISSALAGTGASTGNEESALKGSNLVKKISEDGTVLLKNENNVLPLNLKTNNKVNVFGYSATDNGWVFTGVGSGSCMPAPEKRIGILQGLTNAGFEYNKPLIEKYKEAIPTTDKWLSMNQNGKIIQPPHSFYTNELISDAKQFSDTAIVVLSRNSGENVGEVPAVQTDYLTGEVDSTRSYLDIAKKEEEMLNLVKNNFSKVIVLLNTTNNMQCAFLQDDKIDAALFCGPTGLAGAEGVANLLAGKKSIKNSAEVKEEVLLSPSGRLADTYASNYSSEPVFANRFVRNKSANGGNIVYQEDLYFGYRWYETANESGFFNGLPKGYDSAVIYPFGYGLSYTNFEWKINSVDLPIGSNLTSDSKINVKVEVKNIGEYPGKDVVELYYRTPYIDGGIEKSSISLGDFAKTSVLNPGESQELHLSLSAYDMASYDCYDKNNNGFAGYELDKGEYKLELKTDVHTLKAMPTIVESSLSYNVSDTIKFQKDPTTSNFVINRFTGEDSYAGVAIDGSNVGINENYLSRKDFVGTFRDTQSALPKDNNKIGKARNYTSGANIQDKMPVFEAQNDLKLVTKKDGSAASKAELASPKDLKFNDELVDKLMKSYDDPLWDKMTDQLSKAEARDLVEKSGFGSTEIVSIGKPRTLDFDGPSGFNENTQKIAEDKSLWTSYPCETVIGCTWNKQLAHEIGQSMAFEASKSGISGWYAPGVNLHRSNYNGRNYEYYSEDPIISGKLAGATISGAKSGGLYAYLKHFALSEEGDNARGVDTWITEQNFREIYLKPFEIAVKAGASAIMTAFNRIGPVWAGANYDLCTEILRNEWGFKGSVVTDWSSGDSIMNTNQGVVAGNDLWLNPMKSNGTPLSETNPTEMYCAKLAVKHNLYTYVSTYQYSRDYKETDNEYQVESGIKGPGEVNNWWIYVLASIDVIVFASTLAYGLYIFVPWSKVLKKKESNDNI
ncbi:MAG: glycoside hydrolase family 3 N-terminal domain-containing protein [Bacilli bacterium]